MLRTIAIDDYLTVPDVGTILGITRGRAWALVQEGRLLAHQDQATGEWHIPLRGVLEAALNARPGRPLGRVAPEPMPAEQRAKLPRRLNVRQAAAALGVTDTRVRQMLTRGQLEGALVKGVWRIHRDDIDACIAKRASAA
ncbi:MAG TPA: helix-turn-helix domain-containing protein [Nannocystaceae bacterium]|nr:helix-turn-helix domain-containing protein [Nannocystaceae bacterium]